MKLNRWRIFSIICALIGLALCIVAMLKDGEQPFPFLGLFFANLGIWTNIIVTQKSKKEEKQRG